MARRTFVHPDGNAVVTFDGGLLSDMWTLSVGQHVVAEEKVGFVGQFFTGLDKETEGWGGFELSGGGYEVMVLFNARSRDARVLFVPPGMTMAEFRQTLPTRPLRR